MKRLILVYENCEFFINVENIKLIEYDKGYHSYAAIKIIMTNDYECQIVDGSKTVNFKEIMNEFYESPHDLVKKLKCKSFTAGIKSANANLDDWVSQAMG